MLSLLFFLCVSHMSTFLVFFSITDQNSPSDRTHSDCCSQHQNQSAEQQSGRGKRGNRSHVPSSPISAVEMHRPGFPRPFSLFPCMCVSRVEKSISVLPSSLRGNGVSRQLPVTVAVTCFTRESWILPASASSNNVQHRLLIIRFCAGLQFSDQSSPCSLKNVMVVCLCRSCCQKESELLICCSPPPPASFQKGSQVEDTDKRQKFWCISAKKKKRETVHSFRVCMT